MEIHRRLFPQVRNGTRTSADGRGPPRTRRRCYTRCHNAAEPGILCGSPKSNLISGRRPARRPRRRPPRRRGPPGTCTGCGSARSSRCSPTTADAGCRAAGSHRSHDQSAGLGMGRSRVSARQPLRVLSKRTFAEHSASLVPPQLPMSPPRCDRDTCPMISAPLRTRRYITGWRAADPSSRACGLHGASRTPADDLGPQCHPTNAETGPCAGLPSRQARFCEHSDTEEVTSWAGSSTPTRRLHSNNDSATTTRTSSASSSREAEEHGAAVEAANARCRELAGAFTVLPDELGDEPVRTREEHARRLLAKCGFRGVVLRPQVRQEEAAFQGQADASGCR